MFLAFFIGPRVWRIAKEHNLYTTGDLLELRYGALVRGVVTLLIWLGTLSILAGQLIAGASVLAVVAGVPQWEGTIISAVVVTSYFMAGGLLSSAWVNAVQLVVLLAGFAVAVPMVLSRTDLAASLISAPDIPRRSPTSFISAGPLSGWTLLVFAPAFVVSPGLMQKAYGAASARAVRIGIGLQAIVLALFAFAPPLLGMAARVTHPGLTNPNIVLPTGARANSSRRGSARSRSRRCFRRRSARATPSCSCWQRRSRRISTSASCSPTRTIASCC